MLGLAAVAFWIYVVSRVLPALKRLKGAPPRPASAVAFYLLIVPVAVALLQMVDDRSRDRVEPEPRDREQRAD